MLFILRRIKHYLYFLFLTYRQIYRRKTDKPIIHVIGDSHALLFQNELFIIHHIGPATAYNLRSHNSSTRSREKINTLLLKLPQNKYNTVLFVFGDIDCRNHIYNISKKNNITLSLAIKNTINSYECFLKKVSDGYPHNRIILLNVLPPGEEKNIYNIQYYASRELQLKIIKEFNKQLRELCLKNNYIFLSVFNELLDNSNKRLKKYIFDSVHYNKKIVPFIIKELQLNKLAV